MSGFFSRRTLKTTILFGVLAAAAFAQAPKFKVLVFNKAGGYVHKSITPLSDAVTAWSKEFGFEVTTTADATVFTPASLARFQVVMWNNTTETGLVLNAAQKAAYLDYAKTGGYVGVHGAGDTKGTWADYTNGVVGSELSTHGNGNAVMNQDPQGAAHPVATGDKLGTNLVLDKKITMSDEWYSYKVQPRGLSNLTVLYTLDEKSFSANPPMGDHPITWTRVFPAGGRVFYTGMGHSDITKVAYMKSLIVNALFWAAKMDAGSAINVDGSPARGSAFTAFSAGPASLTVNLGLDGPHSVEIATLDGRRVGAFAGDGRKSYTFANLRPATVYSLSVRTKAGRESRLALVP
jgi:type 1 glutamine amidotransferase